MLDPEAEMLMWATVAKCKWYKIYVPRASEVEMLYWTHGQGVLKFGARSVVWPTAMYSFEFPEPLAK